MKKYLAYIRTPRGAIASIGYYADTPNKNYRIYYNGIDTGIRFEKLGNASRHLERVAEGWRNKYNLDVLVKYAAKNEIPRRGSNA